MVNGHLSMACGREPRACRANPSSLISRATLPFRDGTLRIGAALWAPSGYLNFADLLAAAFAR